jgi:hypothetical protein
MAGNLKVRSQLANASAALKRDPTNPELRTRVDELRAEYRVSDLEDRILRTVSAAPLPTDEQCRRLAALLLRGAA